MRGAFREVHVAPRENPYARIAAISAEVTRSPASFTGLLAAQPGMVAPQARATLREKHALIQSWQRTSLELFAASVRGDLPRTLAAALLDHLPEHFGWGHHARIDLGSIRPPVFFRTDQAADGTVLEVQCPGSGWGMHEIVQDSMPMPASRRPATPRRCRRASSLLTENFAAERLRLLAAGRPVYDLPPVALFDQKLALAFPLLGGNA